MQPLMECALADEPRLLEDHEIEQVGGGDFAADRTHEVWFCEDPEGGYRVWKEAELFD